MTFRAFNWGTLFVCVAGVASAETGVLVTAELTQVVSRPLEKMTVLPGELKPYQFVEIHAKVTGFVESVEVDRGSRVEPGQVLVRMSAPELEAQLAEAEARIAAIEAQRSEAAAELQASESTYERLQEAAKTPGVVAGNDVVLAGKAVEAHQARLDSLQKSILAAQASVRSIEEVKSYLQIKAPFKGTVTERYAHVGALAGPAGRNGMPLLRIEQTERLRLVAPVPEAYTESIRRGTKVAFIVPAYPGQTFSGSVTRPALSLDSKTRTMPVELDVDNASGKLAPGMYAEIAWPVRRRADSLFVPPSAVKSTTERTFVVRISAGRAEWVDVQRGATQENLIEIFGALEDGDSVMLRASDEIRPGTAVQPR